MSLALLVEQEANMQVGVELLTLVLGVAVGTVMGRLVLSGFLALAFRKERS